MKPIRENDPMVKLFGCTSRARILTLLFSKPNQTYYQREVVFETGLSLQAVQRELANLAELGIVVITEGSQRVYYKTNSSSPLFGPLQKICRAIGEDAE